MASSVASRMPPRSISAAEAWPRAQEAARRWITGTRAALRRAVSFLLSVSPRPAKGASAAAGSTTAAANTGPNRQPRPTSSTPAHSPGSRPCQGSGSGGPTQLEAEERRRRRRGSPDSSSSGSATATAVSAGGGPAWGIVAWEVWVFAAGVLAAELRVRPRRAGISTSGGAMLAVVGTDTVTTVSGSLSSGRGVISTSAGISPLPY